jgi:hypothetical protein
MIHKDIERRGLDPTTVINEEKFLKIEHGGEALFTVDPFLERLEI